MERRKKKSSLGTPPHTTRRLSAKTETIHGKENHKDSFHCESSYLSWLSFVCRPFRRNMSVGEYSIPNAMYVHTVSHYQRLFSLSVFQLTFDLVSVPHIHENDCRRFVQLSSHIVVRRSVRSFESWQ